MQYTAGNWTVSSLTTDSVTTKKNIAVPDLSWSTDYAISVEEPEEGQLVNTTGAAISSPEKVRFAAQDIANIYKNTGIDITQQATLKNGRRCMSEISINYQAVNSVSGTEVIIPVKGRIVLELPSAPFVTQTLVNDGLYRTIAAGFDGAGSVDSDRFVELARGSILPE